MPRASEARIAHWKHHVDQWQISGLSGTAYCQQHQLTYHCFIYWRRKFSNAAVTPSTETHVDNPLPNGFVAVRPQLFPEIAETVNTADLHLCLPNGLEIRNIYASNLPIIRSLLEGL